MSREVSSRTDLPSDRLSEGETESAGEASNRSKRGGPELVQTGTGGAMPGISEESQVPPGPARSLDPGPARPETAPQTSSELQSGAVGTVGTEEAATPAVPGTGVGIGLPDSTRLRELALIQANRVRDMGARAWDRPLLSREQFDAEVRSRPSDLVRYGERLNRLPRPVEDLQRGDDSVRGRIADWESLRRNSRSPPPRGETEHGS